MTSNKKIILLLTSLIILVGCVITPTAISTPAPPTDVPVEPTATSMVVASSTSTAPVETPAETIAPTDVPPTLEPPAGLSEVQKKQARDLINTNCSVCHSTDRISAAQKDQAGWATTVNRMLSKGAALTSDEAALVIQYLAEGNKP